MLENQSGHLCKEVLGTNKLCLHRLHFDAGSPKINKGDLKQNWKFNAFRASKASSLGKKCVGFINKFSDH